MKKLFAFILCAAAVLSMAGCVAAPGEISPQETTEETVSPFAGVVADPVTWLAEFESLPIANENMSTDELRQLCADAFKANMTFQWTPNQPISYTYTILGKPKGEVYLPTGIAYSGLCYCTGKSSGTIYKVLKYYDRETGVVDVAAMGDKMLGILSSACALGAQTAWNRVSNSHNLQTMGTYNRFSANILPVGPYAYEIYDYNYDFGSLEATTQIIERNGKETMYESFAQMLVADGLYSSPSWHVMMCSSVPVVVRDGEGKIDPEQSYVLVHEQRANGTQSDKYNTPQSNGVDLRPLGTVDRKYTFKKLLDKGYIPFTLKEFVGLDPVEPGEAWLGSEQERLEKGADMTLQQLEKQTLYTNYVLCVVEVEVHDPNGEVLLSYDPALQTRPVTYSVPVQAALDMELLGGYADGKNTIHIYARLANGERLEAFSTILK